MTDIHSLQNTVVAVFESPDDAKAAAEQLASAGYEIEVLQGEEASDHLDPEGDEGIWASLKRLASALGDERRILNRLDREVAEGNVAVSVDIEDGDAAPAIKIMRECGGRFIWKFGEWAFTPIEL
ncbi:MAG: hypothetical protein DWQ40_11360 [Actinobacteria bacterium]|nr:MAG: hypothetical protein DWQ40_11360 [Actinomycetota bacterium]